MLVSPLDWGIGHAARCIPLIEMLLTNNCKVFIAANTRGKWLLQKEFPAVTFIDLPGYTIRYNKILPVWFSVFLQLAKIFRTIRKEQIWLKHAIEKHGIEIVISDNRPGLYSKTVPCIYITHQICIKSFNWAEPLFYKLHKHFIERFSFCWIPDFEEVKKCIAGDLSHKFITPDNAAFIGILSRFEKYKNCERKNIDADILVILSGPEPQRTLLEEIILNQACSIDRKFIIVRGLTESIRKRNLSPTIQLIDSLNSAELCNYILSAKKIICRSGYSTIMDLVALNKTALLIPTPGQTEQEYLAEYLKDKSFEAVRQKKLNIGNII